MAVLAVYAVNIMYFILQFVKTGQKIGVSESSSVATGHERNYLSEAFPVGYCTPFETSFRSVSKPIVQNRTV